MARAHAMAALSGVLYCLAFPAFDLWPLSFVCLVPVLWALARHVGRGRDAWLVGLTFGVVTQLGGYYWLPATLDRFSGLPAPISALIALVVALYQGGQLALFAWLVHRARARGLPAALLSPLLLVASEYSYPLLFPSYLANGLHAVPLLMQVVDLGGPGVLSAVIAAVNVALAGLLRAAHARRAAARAEVALGAGLLLASALYGTVRIAAVDAAVAAAPKLDVALIQADLGLLEKREDFEEALRRHVALSRAVVVPAPPDLIVWPETALPITLPPRPDRLSRLTGELGVPLLFGGLIAAVEDGRRTLYNASLLADREGRVRSTYEKAHLVPFGEYIPLGDVFPVLYTLSAQSGRFSPGDSRAPLALPDGTRLSALICYEDIFPADVRRSVAAGAPHLLVNQTNDAWFGDTSAPWLHLALAKFRAVEHHRYLLRATNSGVTSVIDPTGRVIAVAPVFEQTTLRAQVALLRGPTPYARVGDALGWVALLVALLAAGPWDRRRAPAAR